MKITQLVILLLIPLLVETVFLGAIFVSFDELEREREREARTLDGLLRVNMTYYDMASAAGSMMMGSVWHEPSYMIEFADKYTTLKRDAKELNEMNTPDHPGRKEISAMSAVVNDAIATFESVDGLTEDAFEKDNVATIEKLKSFLRRMDNAGKGVVERQIVIRKKSEEDQSEKRQAFRNTIVGAAAGNLIMAIFAVIVFRKMFARRFKVLVDNTVGVALGKPLQPPLEGKDEIAALDRLVHQLANELAQARRSERAILDNTTEIICSIDEMHRLTEVNRAVEIRLGYYGSDLLGTNIQSIIHPDDRESTYADLEKAKETRREVVFEARVKSSKGKFVHTQWNAMWSPDDKSFFCVMHDITERKEAERLKQEVIAMVSHDLRAPLTSLGMILDMLLEGTVGGLNEKGGRLVHRAKFSVSSLINMINDLIDVERFEAGGINLNYESINTNEVVTPGVELLKAETERKKLSIFPQIDDVNFDADKERLARVVMNLLNNAIKFTPDGKRIYITCKKLKTRTGDGMVEFKIIDEGPGIPQEKLDLVFEKFKQVGTGDEGEKKGSGLGLAICKAIVEAHHGRIGVFSEKGEGCTFWFTLPISKPGSQTISRLSSLQHEQPSEVQ